MTAPAGWDRKRNRAMPARPARASVPRTARTDQRARDAARNGHPRPFGYTGVSPQMVTRCMIRVCVG